MDFEKYTERSRGFVQATQGLALRRQARSDARLRGGSDGQDGEEGQAGEKTGHEEPNTWRRQRLRSFDRSPCAG